MIQLPILALIVIVTMAAWGPLGALGALYAIRRTNKFERVARDAQSESRETTEHMDAHMRALDVINDPDLNSAEDEPRRRDLRLLSVVAATPGAVEWMRDKVKAYPIPAASVVTLAAAAGFVAVIWQAIVPDAPISLNQPPPVTTATTAPSESPVSPTGPPAAPIVPAATIVSPAATVEPSRPVPRTAAAATPRPSSPARPTTSPKPQLGSPTTTSAPSVSSPACVAGGQDVNGVRVPCVAP